MNANVPVIFLACVGMLIAPAITEAANPPGPSSLHAMEETFERGLAANDAPGGSLAVVSDERILRSQGFGEADGSGTPVTAGTPFLLGSTTKSFTALAVMQLVERGEVELDAPVRDYVPEFELAGDFADRITVRQVLQHTSGVPPNSEGGPILKLAADGTPLEAIAELRGKELVSEPGEEMEYVNANYVLAGLVVERASGLPYAEYVERNIFEPLEMDDTFADPEAARADGLAAGHRYIFGITEETGTSFRPAAVAAGYIMSSADDMARYLAVFLNEGVGLNGRRILSAHGVESLLTPAAGPATEFSGPAPETILGPWADGVRSRYAMGWFVGGPWEEPAILHPGDAVDSSSLIVLLPQRNLGVAVMVSSSNELPVPGNPAALGRVERNAVDALLGEPADPGTTVKRFYLIFNLVTAIILAAALFSLYLAIRDARRARPPRHRPLSIIATPFRIALAAIFLFYPGLIGYGWRATFVWHPDLAIALALISITLIAVLAARVVWLARTRHGNQHESDVESSAASNPEVRRATQPSP